MVRDILGQNLSSHGFTLEEVRNKNNMKTHTYRKPENLLDRESTFVEADYSRIDKMDTVITVTVILVVFGVLLFIGLMALHTI